MTDPYSLRDIEPRELAREAAEEIARRSGVARHDVAITLGSGWAGALSELGEVIAEHPAAEIPGFTPSPVAGHGGTISTVRLSGGAHALSIGARTHLYEGRGVDAVVHGVRTAAAAGARTMVLTNGAGSLRNHLMPGRAVLIADHINLTARSPLIGASFVDLTDLYSRRLRAMVQELSPGITQGVYVQFHGPQYETPAEIAMAQTMGGDLVGMSTALEAIAAREAGLEVLGLSLVTNLAAGLGSSTLDHQEVLETGRNAAANMAELLAGIMDRLVTVPPRIGSA